MVREAATFSHYVDRLAYVDVGTGRTGTMRFARSGISNLLQHTIRVPPCVELVPPPMFRDYVNPQTSPPL